MLKLKTYRLILYCLIAVSALSCQSVFQPLPPANSFNLSFPQRQTADEELETTLQEALKQRIQCRGYSYETDPYQARLKLLVVYQYQAAQGIMSLNVKLSLSAPETQKEVWSETASSLVLRADGLDKLVDPVAWTLSSRLPYAPDFGGVGIILSKEMRIINFSDNSPAQRAGLKKNDLIVRIDQQAKLDYQKCLQLLCGRAGTTAEITVRRDEQEQTFVVTRSPIGSLDFNGTQPAEIQPLAIDQLKKKLASP